MVIKRLPELIVSYIQAIYYINNYKNDILDLSSIKFFYPTTLLPLLHFINDTKCKYIEPNDIDAKQYFNIIIRGQY